MKKRIWAFMLSVAMLASCSVTASAAKISGVYREDREDTLSNYASAYGWDPDLLEKPFWTDEFCGDEVPFSRLRGYQKEFYRDNITTTFLQLGLTPGSYGGGGSMVAVALGEFNADDNAERPKGSNNVKYNTWYYGHEVSGSDYPWCAAFISWCAEQCGYLDSNLFLRTASSTAHYNYLTNTLGLPSYEVTETFLFGGYYTPVPGDIELFRDNSGFCHIGIIVEVTDSGWYTVEGNSGDKVSKNFYDSNCSSMARRGCIVNVAYPAENDKNTKTIFTFLTKVMGMNSAAACGVLGNLDVLSGLDPTKTNNGGYGLGQWKGSRSETLRTEVQKWGKGSLKESAFATVEGQLWFMKWELEQNYAGVLQQLKNLPDTLEGSKSASEILLNQWESGTSRGVAALQSRQQAAAIYWQQLGNK